MTLYFNSLPFHSLALLETDFGLSYAKKGELLPYIIKVFRSWLLIFRGKKAKFRGIFKGKFAEKSANFARLSREKKSKFAEKSADFAGFSREKSQNSQKNRPILRDFQGQIVRKIGRCHGKFRGETSPRNNQ